MQPIDNKTLAAIGGQTTLASATAFAGTMAQAATTISNIRTNKDQLALAEEKWQAQKAINKQSTESAELDMHIKRAEMVGRSAIGVLELQSQGEPDEFPINYASFREQQHESVRKYMPEASALPEDLKEWATRTAMQSEQGVPYLKALKTDNGLKEWQYNLDALASVRNGTADNAQIAKVDYMYAMTPSLQQAPTAGQTDSALLGIQNFELGEDTLGSRLDTKSIGPLANRIASERKILAEQAKQDRNPALMAGADSRIIQGLMDTGHIVPAKSLLDNPWVSIVAKDWIGMSQEEINNLKGDELIYVENPKGLADAALVESDNAEKDMQQQLNPDPTPPTDMQPGEERVVGKHIFFLDPESGEIFWDTVGE